MIITLIIRLCRVYSEVIYDLGYANNIPYGILKIT